MSIAPSSTPPGQFAPGGFSRSLAALFAGKGVIRDFVAGETILGRGTSGEAVRFLLSGRATVILHGKKNEKTEVTTLGPGDIFGGIEFFFGVPWSSGAELCAAEACRVLEIPPYHFEEVLRSNPDFCAALVRKLVQTNALLQKELHELKLRKRALRRLISREDHLFPDYIMGEHVKRRLGERIEQLAASPGHAVIFGESGVGKEGVAHHLFSKSADHKSVFLMLDALSAREKQLEQSRDLGEAEFEKRLTEHQKKLLFGSEERAANGRLTETSGYLELAEQGTLLVRGADSLTVGTQLQLLDALRKGVFSRWGTNAPIPLSVRIIATTRLLPSEISPETQPFLWSLMSRSLHVPPLRSRRREIPGLAKRYVKNYAGEGKGGVKEIPAATLKLLVDYPWPGNDLELALTLKQAVASAQGLMLRPDDIRFQRLRAGGAKGADLLKSRLMRQAVESPLFPAVLQGAACLFFAAMLAALLFGPSDPFKNVGSMFAWAVGWPLLIIGSFVWARFWCSLCPVGFAAEVAANIACLRRPIPSFLKRRPDFVLAAAVFFIIWLEIAAGLRQSPFYLGLLLFAMLLSAIAASMVFEPQAWCLRLCGLGGIIGVLAKTSPLELRADPNVCIAQCANNVCYWGTDRYPGCPYGQSGPKLDDNRLCKLCGLCVKNCGHNAFGLNLRAPGQEIWTGAQPPRLGTAFLIIGLPAGLFGELVIEAPWFKDMVIASGAPSLVIFTVLFIGIILVANGLTIAAALVSARSLPYGPKENYARFALTYLPLTLTAFAAFHLYYFAALGDHLLSAIAAVFDPTVTQPPLLAEPGAPTAAITFALLWVGAVWSIIAMYKTAQAAAAQKAAAVRGAAPHIALAFAGALLLHRAFQWFLHS
jgi:DNA-binding NtrC family response regulator/polyferredoxin